MRTGFLFCALLSAIALTGCLLLVQPVWAAGNDNDPSWNLSGDARIAYIPLSRDNRDGTTSQRDSFGARFRLRLQRDFSSGWRFQTRFAANAADNDNDFDLYFQPERQRGTAVTSGTATLDEFFLQYRSGDGRTQLRIGRQQSSTDRALVTNKNFDRQQTSNVNIGWTDAISLTRQLDQGWVAKLFLEYNSRNGNGSNTRGPINFADSGSRVSSFVSLENQEAWGPIILRALSLTWYPDALASEGLDQSTREDYFVLTGKLAAGWDVGHLMGTDATRLVIGGELAYAPNRQQNFVANLPGSDEVDGWGWQFGVDLHEFWPNQKMGIVYGQADAGQLISNAFRPNEEQFEARWQWRFAEDWRVEVRARWRYELDLLENAQQRRRDRDARLRFTYYF